MNAPDSLFLPDVQSTADLRQLAIQQVGVRAIRHPVMIASANGPQPTVASIDMFVGLPAHQKGTHMSRFIALLQENREPLSAEVLGSLLRSMLLRLEASSGSIEARFAYFINKAAPVSGVESLMDYDVTLGARMSGGTLTLTQKVVVPVTSACPCSKRIADYGAHNQRSHVSVQVELAAPLALDQQIRIAETSGSCEVWALLKRPDEKYVTEQAYDNPKFVEDMVRDVALELNRDARVVAYTVECENFESIHNHSAYALIAHDKRVPG
ncbi:MAG TPA: GTP cyclohydrolase FolE2 [Burkholderiaceae bacterium]|jgi:GTP cyclohydrolase I|nr:GTP cyclohydrolase FolE2 [Burkholderiaceae bacterium]